MELINTRETATDRFLALSARYLLHSRVSVDEQGRVLVEWVDTPASAAEAKPSKPRPAHLALAA